MACVEFSLAPHPASALPGPIQIKGRMARPSGALSMRFELLGSLDEIVIPARAKAPARKDRLWENTCFELFLAPENSSQYWEINLSPAGHWNIYHFSHYRQSMQEEAAFRSLPFTFADTGSMLSLDVEIDADAILNAGDLKAGVSAVLEHTSSKPTYWALAHGGLQPDFHAPGSFLIHLAGRSSR